MPLDQRLAQERNIDSFSPISRILAPECCSESHETVSPQSRGKREQLRGNLPPTLPIHFCLAGSLERVARSDRPARSRSTWATRGRAKNVNRFLDISQRGCDLERQVGVIPFRNQEFLQVGCCFFKPRAAENKLVLHGHLRMRWLSDICPYPLGHSGEMRHLQQEAIKSGKNRIGLTGRWNLVRTRRSVG